MSRLMDMGDENKRVTRPGIIDGRPVVELGPSGFVELLPLSRDRVLQNERPVGELGGEEDGRAGEDAERVRTRRARARNGERGGEEVAARWSFGGCVVEASRPPSSL